MHDPSQPKKVAAEEALVNRVLAEYMEALERGDAPEREEFLARHLGIAAELEAFLDDLDHLDGLGEKVLSPERGASAHLSPAVPPRLGDYELIEEIGRGGMGVVYKARQVSLKRIVALKILLPGPMASSEEIRRFRLEAESSAVLDHLAG